jgi:hypothetical protein
LSKRIISNNSPAIYILERTSLNKNEKEIFINNINNNPQRILNDIEINFKKGASKERKFIMINNSIRNINNIQ